MKDQPHTHPEFPELTVTPSMKNMHGVEDLATMVRGVSGLINNDLATHFATVAAESDGTDLVAATMSNFFSRLARDVDAVSLLLSEPERLSPAMKATLEQFRRRVMGDDYGW